MKKTRNYNLSTRLNYNEGTRKEIFIKLININKIKYLRGKKKK